MADPAHLDLDPPEKVKAKIEYQIRKLILQESGIRESYYENFAIEHDFFLI